MGFLKEQWEKFRAKSLFGKFFDVLFIVLIITMFIPEGRVMIQRVILNTGFFSSSKVNDNTMLSPSSIGWQLTDLEGNTTTLGAMEGQVVFINFWGTWCPPCNAEMPGIIGLMERVNPEVEFVFATSDPSINVKNHLAKKSWELPAYTYTHNPGNELMTASLPSTFIIDKEGKIVHRSSGMKQWNTQAAEDLLNGLSGR